MTQMSQGCLTDAIAGWQLAAHICAAPPPADWRDALAKRLGQRPRRLGRCAELALYGARLCLDAADSPVLPMGAILRVCSLNGFNSASQTIARQRLAGLPMPFAFIQSQPSQMLAALTQFLDWRGDASFMAGRDWQVLQRMALHEATAFDACALLMGRVEEEGDILSTEWSLWRALPCTRKN